MKKQLLAAIAAAALPLSPLAAEDKLEEIVVISSRIELPLRQVGTAVSSIDAGDIRARGFNSLADVLRTLPGVSVSNSGGAGKVTSLSIRGENGSRTLVLLDGMEISDPTLPQAGPQLQHLLSAGIARVEILRGTQGMLYGADAGGVVNIITPRGEAGLAGDLDIEAGRYGSRQLAGNIRGGTETVDFYLSAADFSTDGFNARDLDTELRDDDGYDNTTVHGRLGWNVDEHLRLELVVRDIDGDNEYDSCFSSASTDNCSNDFEQTSSRLSGSYSDETFSHTLSITDNDIERALFADGALSFGTEGNIRRLEYLGSASLAGETTLVYGIEHESEDMKTNFGQDFDRDQHGYYLEYQNHYWEAVFFSLGVRHDDNDDFGEHTSYRATSAYLLPLRGDNSLKLKASYGTGFRAPSLFEVGTNAGATREPASLVTLKEETSEGFDIGVEYFGGNGLHLEAIYFNQRIDDEITFDLDGFSGYLQFSGTSKSSGVELIGELPVGDHWLLSGNYTYNDTEDAGGNARSLRPRHLANLGLGYDNQRWGFAVNLRTSRDAEDLAANAELEDYELVDINARYRVNRAVEVYARVENALGEDYQEVATYNTADSAAYLGVRMAF